MVYLLLQFVHWFDALILVYNVIDELSCTVLPGYYARMSQYRDLSDLPLFLVGVKGITIVKRSDIFTQGCCQSQL